MRAESVPVRALVLLGAVHYLVVGVFLAAALGAFAGLYACGEGCFERSGGTHWSRFDDAWQWDLLLVSSLASLAAGTLVLVVWRLARARRALFAVHAVLLTAIAAVVASAEMYSLPPEGLLLFGSAEAAGLFAVLASRPLQAPAPADDARRLLRALAGLRALLLGVALVSVPVGLASLAAGGASRWTWALLLAPFSLLAARRVRVLRRRVATEAGGQSG